MVPSPNSCPKASGWGLFSRTYCRLLASFPVKEASTSARSRPYSSHMASSAGSLFGFGLFSSLLAAASVPAFKDAGASHAWYSAVVMLYRRRTAHWEFAGISGGTCQLYSYRVLPPGFPWWFARVVSIWRQAGGGTPWGGMVLYS